MGQGHADAGGARKPGRFLEHTQRGETDTLPGDWQGPGWKTQKSLQGHGSSGPTRRPRLPLLHPPGAMPRKLRPHILPPRIGRHRNAAHDQGGRGAPNSAPSRAGRNRPRRVMQGVAPGGRIPVPVEADTWRAQGETITPGSRAPALSRARPRGGRSLARREESRSWRQSEAAQPFRLFMIWVAMYRKRLPGEMIVCSVGAGRGVSTPQTTVARISGSAPLPMLDRGRAFSARKRRGKGIVMEFWNPGLES